MIVSFSLFYEKIRHRKLNEYTLFRILFPGTKRVKITVTSCSMEHIGTTNIVDMAICDTLKFVPVSVTIGKLLNNITYIICSFISNVS